MPVSEQEDMMKTSVIGFPSVTETDASLRNMVEAARQVRK